MVQLAALLWSALLAAPPASPADIDAYRQAASRVGRDAGAHVKLALWCEAHGLQPERLKHLAIAVLTDPANATARGLMGLVAYRGKWQRPDAVAETVKSDEELAAALAEYNGRRARTANTADAQWKLALWCEEQGLKAEALAHLATVVRLDPSREAAWKRLGCKKVGGRWVTEAQITAEKAESEAQKRANKYWLPLLTKWRGWLGEKSKRPEAEKALADVTDPRAVPALWATFGFGTPVQQAVAVRVLGQIDSPGSSRRLAGLAVFSPSADVRRAATETLRRRDPREFLGLLVALVRDPIQYEVRPVGGPGSPGALFVHGNRFNVQRLYSPPPMKGFYLPPNIMPDITTDSNGLPVLSELLGMSETMMSKAQAGSTIDVSSANGGLTGFLLSGGLGNAGVEFGQNLSGKSQFLSRELASIKGGPNAQVRVDREKYIVIPLGEMILEAQLAAAVSQQQLRNDVDAIERFNALVGESNSRVLPVLTSLTGQDLGEDQKAWSTWWTDEQGYVVSRPYEAPVPTVVENIPPAYVPQTMPQVLDGPTVAIRQHSCFGGGTLVQTLTGPRPIETLRSGDQVLTQEPSHGRLSFQPIIAAYHNSPNRTLKIALEDETIIATGIHRFWKSGKGWTMARDLKPGDALRTVGGTVAVTAVTDDQVQPVFNLQVAEGASFFVGDRGTLVHDNSLVQPTPEPFDAPPELAGVGTSVQ